jgi:hypothetical protein
MFLPAKSIAERALPYWNLSSFYNLPCSYEQLLGAKQVFMLMNINQSPPLGIKRSQREFSDLLTKFIRFRKYLS